MENLLHCAKEMKASLVRIRRRLHSFAECGFNLPKTSEFVKRELQNIGYMPRNCGRCGIVCDLNENTDRPAVLLRADMDALPIQEETGLPFRSKNGNMHACGHDMHTAMLIGAASLLKKWEKSLSAPVRLVFQAAEETLAGAEDIKRAGVLSGVGAAVMLHAVTAVPFPTGTLLLPPSGIGAPAARFFEIEVSGKIAHVGEAEKGANALDAAVSLYLAMQREKEGMGGGLLLSVGLWNAGDAPNIVPAKARLSGSFRSLDQSMVAEFEEKLAFLCKKTAGEVTASVCMPGGAPPLKNDARIRAALEASLPQMGFAVQKMSASSGNASEDFAVLAAEVPSLALAISAGERARGYEHPLHHPKVLFDEDALPIGAAAYAHAAILLGGDGALQTFTKETGA